MSHPANTSAPPQLTHAGQVLSVSPLTSTTFQVELQTPPGTEPAYQAGQYLQLELDVNGDGCLQSLFYSIANGFDPEAPRRLQLLIQHTGEFTDRIIAHLCELRDTRAPVKITLPLGQAYLQTDLNLPHLLIAAGSGIAKIKCLTETILRRRPDAQVSIYWSNRKPEAFYGVEAFQGLAEKHANLSFTPILERADDRWPGATGFIYEVIENELENLAAYQVYLCGSPRMVYGTIDRLKLKGLTEAACYSDVFEYAPRDERVAV